MWFRISLFLLAGSLFAQHSFTPADVRDGEHLFLSNCAVCHGPEGNMVPGIDLAHGSFRRATTDSDLVQIILSGIPGTAMPPHNFMNFQALTIVAFLRSLASTQENEVPRGDSALGKAIFEGKGNCQSCHRVRWAGSRLGPDLTDIGASRRAVEIERSLREPDAEGRPEYRFVRVVMNDGAEITGRLLNHDSFTVQLLDSEERLISLQKSNLKDYTAIDKSRMPSYAGKLTPAELADVVGYLVSLKGIETQ